MDGSGSMITFKLVAPTFESKIKDNDTLLLPYCHLSTCLDVQNRSHTVTCSRERTRTRSRPPNFKHDPIWDWRYRRRNTPLWDQIWHFWLNEMLLINALKATVTKFKLMAVWQIYQRFIDPNLANWNGNANSNIHYLHFYQILSNTYYTNSLVMPTCL